MRAILIDPHLKGVAEIELPDGGDQSRLRAFYKAIDCETITSLMLGQDKEAKQGHIAFLDDEGLYKDGQCYWQIEGYDQPLAGRAVVLNCTDRGESAPCTMTLAALEKRLSWPDVEFVSMDQTQTEGDLFGRPARILKMRANFAPRKTDEPQ